MLSYQHHYHAGNHADVLKHWLLIECINHLQRKAKPFDYIDTHAGAGRYRLDSDAALKTGESKDGVLKLEWSSLPGLDAYHQMVGEDLEAGYYPGSPMLVKRLLRPGDHAWLFELHPQTLKELSHHCAERRVSYVRQEDGFKALSALLPTSSRRALVLIDPSYEIKSDYQRVVEVMVKSYQKMPQLMLLLWYPIVDRQQIDQLERAIEKSPLRNVQLFEMAVEADNHSGMTGSGMIAINPPWTLAERFEKSMPAVSLQLSKDRQARTRFRQLCAE